MNLHRLDLVSQSLSVWLSGLAAVTEARNWPTLAVGAANMRISDREGTVGAELFERSINLHAVPVQLGDVAHQRHRDHAHDQAVAISSPT